MIRNIFNQGLGPSNGQNFKPGAQNPLKTIIETPNGGEDGANLNSLAPSPPPPSSSFHGKEKNEKK